MFNYDQGAPDLRIYDYVRVLDLSGDYKLMNLDGTLWLVEMNDACVWYISELVPDAYANIDDA